MSSGSSDFRRKLREAQRQIDAYNREVNRVNRENQRRVNEYNRRVNQHNQRVLSETNRYNRRADAHNREVINQLNRVLRSPAASGPTYTPQEQVLADRVYGALLEQGSRDYDVFLSYARIDGSEVAEELRAALEALGVSVWFDAVSIAPGQSQARQMDRGLQAARCGIALLTPAYLAGRFWTERELGALLHKDTLIPVLHAVTFEQVAEYSGILPDLAGFETRRDTVQAIAEKIAAAVLRDAGAA